MEEKKCRCRVDLIAVLDHSVDLIIISAGHRQYKSDETIHADGLDPVLIYDTIGLFNEDSLSRLQSKHKVSVLGRGDC